MVSPLRRVPFGKRHKRNQKVSPLSYGPSLRLGVPSLRHSSGGIASGLLRDDLLSMCSASPHGAARPPPRINASTQPAEGAGGSRSAGELTLGLWSGEERGCARNRLGGWRPDCRPISRRYVQESVGAGLLAIASNQSLHMHPFQLWEPDCWRWRPDNQPIPPGYTPSTLQLITETNAVPRLAIEGVQRFIGHGFGRFQCNVVVPGIAKP